jgi:hypothetical protein
MCPAEANIDTQQCRRFPNVSGGDGKRLTQ